MLCSLPIDQSIGSLNRNRLRHPTSRTCTHPLYFTRPTLAIRALPGAAYFREQSDLFYTHTGITPLISSFPRARPATPYIRSLRARRANILECANPNPIAVAVQTFAGQDTNPQSSKFLLGVARLIEEQSQRSLGQKADELRLTMNACLVEYRLELHTNRVGFDALHVRD